MSGRRRELVPKRVIWFDNRAVFADAGAHPRPECFNESKPVHLSPRGQCIPQDRQNKAGMTRRAIKSNPTRGIPNFGVRKPPFNQSEIIFRSDIFNTTNVRQKFSGLHPVKKSGNQRICHAISNRFNTQNFTSISQYLMPSIQDANFHALIGVNIVRYRGTNMFPRRATRAKSIFNDPLAIVFMGDWNRVLNTYISDKGQLRLSRYRHNTVNHSIGKKSSLVNPLCKIRVCQSRQSDDRAP